MMTIIPNTASYKGIKTVAAGAALMALTILFSQCKPSYEELKAQNLPKIQAVLAKHKTRMYDYMGRLKGLKETLKDIDTAFVSTAKLQPVLHADYSGLPENLLIYTFDELNDSSINDYNDHYGMGSMNAFKYAFQSYNANDDYINYAEDPKYLEERLSDFNLEKQPYALILEEIEREEAKLEGEGFVGGTVTVKVYLVDMRSNTVLGCGLVYGEPPEVIEARYKESEGKQNAFERQITQAMNASVENGVIVFLKKFNGFISDDTSVTKGQ